MDDFPLFGRAHGHGEDPKKLESALEPFVNTYPPRMIENLKPIFTVRRLRNGLYLVSSAAAVLIAIKAIAVAVNGDRAEGSCGPVTLLTENFDGVTPPTLPTGWSSTTWVTSDSGVPTPPADSAPNAAFVDDPAMISDKQLVSPNIFLSQGDTPVEITFRNNYNFQDRFDGGVLEISTDGGNTFVDILAVGTFVTGGYTGTISTCCGNPLGGRQAWTGNSSGFTTTTVNLEVTWGPNMVLRWRMGSDSSVSGEGWRIDTVLITQCHKLIPPTPRPSPAPRPRPTPAPRPTP